jgi:hypothetical protein
MALYVFASFEHSTYLELALATLEENGIERENILAVPLDRRKPKSKLFDTIHASDGTSLFDIAMAVATAFAVLGASFGFEWKWGPIIWGLLGAVIGFATGLAISLIQYWIKHRGEKRTNKKKVTEVIVIVDCEPDQKKMIKTTLWDYKAFGVGELKQ